MTTKKNDTDILFSETIINLVQSFINDSDFMFYFEEELMFINFVVEEFSEYNDLLNNEIFMSNTNHYE